MSSLPPVYVCVCVCVHVCVRLQLPVLKCSLVCSLQTRVNFMRTGSSEVAKSWISLSLFFFFFLVFRGVGYMANIINNLTFLSLSDKL